MPAVKVTLQINAGTVDAGGNAARIGGFSEQYYSTLPIDSDGLLNNWNSLATKRAALLPTNCRIVGSRYQAVDPNGGSRSFDNIYSGSAGLQNDLPQVALQYTVRSANTPNQRSLTLRACPDDKVQFGEYKPSAAFNSALATFFRELQTNWKFRCIDRTILPVKIITIDNTGLMTTVGPHGLAAGDVINIMSTVDGQGDKHSFKAAVQAFVTASSALLFLDRRDFGVPWTRGRVRKVGIHYESFSITPQEIVTPTAVTKKVGRPFRQFHGRRSATKS